MNAPAIRRAIQEGTAWVLREQGPDGVWRSLYLGGPVHVAAGLLATCLLEPSSPARFNSEWDLVESLLDAQDAEGGWAPYPGAPPSVDVTRIAGLGLQLFSDNHAPLLRDKPALARTLGAAVTRAEGFRRSQPASKASPFLDLLADLFWDAAYPERSHELVVQPLSAEAAELFLRSTWTYDLRNRISTFARQAVPAIAILFETSASRSRWVRWLDRLAAFVGHDTSTRALGFLEREVLKLQARTGGWLWSVLGTTLNLLALRALGYRAQHPAVRRGLDFIHRLRMPGPKGHLHQGWCNAELWDSSVVAATLRFCGMSPQQFHAATLAARLVDEQASDGLWAFGEGALEGDNDSSALVLAGLCRLQPHLPESAAREVAVSIRRAVRPLLEGQQTDGGWGYGPEPHEAPYSFGDRSPYGLETTLVDGSTPDVTGRVLGALASARATGLLDAGTQASVGRAFDRALRYLQVAQTEVGSWQGRWTAGYLSPLVFILPVLRAEGVRMDAPWLGRALAFVRRTQNGDGGWGESPRADQDALIAGVGPSTPVQTAYALAARVALFEGAGLEDDAQVMRGVDFLLRAQADGRWENGRALYTVAFRDDYFDASLMTQTMVLCVLRYVERALEVGPAQASVEFAVGGTAGVHPFARTELGSVRAT